jgi:Protein of Unknown function (DUF2784)
MYHVLTEITIIAHLAFILFVIAGGLLARRRRWLIPVHLVALTWAVYAEFSPGIVCPLTAIENFFAGRTGITGYSGDFVAHYLVPVIYQESLPPQWQYVVAAVVLALNVFIYASLLWSRSQDTRKVV